MTGQRFNTPGRVVVFVENEGKVYGFDVDGSVYWTWIGVASNGRSMAHLGVRGVFQRKWRSVPGQETAFERMWNEWDQAEEGALPAPPAELER